MNLERVTAGRDVPNDVNVIIEIPMLADPVKYEVDKATGAVFVDRFMSTAMHYPCNYGYVPRTLSGDGDPVDVLVLSPLPLITGVVVRCRPIAMLRMKDEAGEDTKLLAVPIDKLTSQYRNVHSPRDVPEAQLAALLERDGLRLQPGVVRVSYASGCRFHGYSAPHLVVQTNHGPVTVLVLPHELARGTPERIHASGFDGVIVPAPRGVLVALGHDMSVEGVAHAALRALVYET